LNDAVDRPVPVRTIGGGVVVGVADDGDEARSAPPGVGVGALLAGEIVAVGALALGVDVARVAAALLNERDPSPFAIRTMTRARTRATRMARRLLLRPLDGHLLVARRFR